MRLEHSSAMSSIVYPSFQFHKGAIRTCIRLSSHIRNTSFNSIKVRLEQCARDSSSDKQKCFNSIKVRLEHTEVSMSRVLSSVSIP